jgi:actin-related protein
MVSPIIANSRSEIDAATVVIDNGTGYSKMGYAGNMEPSYLIPSVVATQIPKKVSFKLRSNFDCLGLHEHARQQQDDQ